MPLLDIQGLGRRFSGLVALDDVSFGVKESEVVGLIGPNGAGKTTLINLITGVTTPSAGQILLRGKSLVGMRAHQIARLGVARTFQHIRLFGDMTVLENVMVGLHNALSAGYLASALRTRSVTLEESSARAQATECLERVAPDLLRLRDTPARALPYADKRRLEIARALALRPALLLLDEPAAGMAPQEIDRLSNDLRNLDYEGTAVIVIEHKMKLIEGVTDKVVVLDHGRKIFEGHFDSVKRDPVVIEAYLGRSYTHADAE